MLIAFRSKADADVLMLWGPAQDVLAALGRTPSPEGIFLPEQIEPALQALAQALKQPDPAATEGDTDDDALVTLARRAWPLKTMLERAQALAVPVVWGAA